MDFCSRHPHPPPLLNGQGDFFIQEWAQQPLEKFAEIPSFESMKQLPRKTITTINKWRGPTTTTVTVTAMDTMTYRVFSGGGAQDGLLLPGDTGQRRSQLPGVIPGYSQVSWRPVAKVQDMYGSVNRQRMFLKTTQLFMGILGGGVFCLFYFPK